MSTKTKILIEIVLSLFLIIIFSPVLVTLSILAAIDTKQFPLFSQERGLTLSSGRFKLYKLRTIKSAENLPKNQDQILGHSIYRNDISAFGLFLRRSGLDELPQLFNIFKGEMSFIGPRPLQLDDLENIKKYFPELYDIRNKLNVKPGLTGYWQINKDDDITVENLVQLDKYFVENQTIALDALILFKSLMLFLSGKHKDSLQFKFDENKNLDVSTPLAS